MSSKWPVVPNRSLEKKSEPSRKCVLSSPIPRLATWNAPISSPSLVYGDLYSSHWLRYWYSHYRNWLEFSKSGSTRLSTVPRRCYIGHRNKRTSGQGVSWMALMLTLSATISRALTTQSSRREKSCTTDYTTNPGYLTSRARESLSRTCCSCWHITSWLLTARPWCKRSVLFLTSFKSNSSLVSRIS